MLEPFDVELVPRNPSCGTRLALLTLSLYQETLLRDMLKPFDAELVP